MKLKYTQKVFLIILLNLILNSLVQAQETNSISPAQTDSAGTPGKKDSVIRIGYGVQLKKYITSAVSTVRGEDLEKGFRLNLGSTLFGQLAGTTTLQGGSEPGASAPTIYGRGRNTFGGANDQPLIIIDGYIGGGSGTGSGFMQLVPEEVESVNFLKDASATAIYGSRAANGVILVTTKRGNISPLQVSFTTRQGLSQAQFIPRVLNSYDYANLYNEALTNDALPQRYTPSDLAAYQDNSDPVGHPNIDWYSTVLRKSAPVSSYDLSFRGGDKTTKYFVLLNALNNQGLYKKFGDMNDLSTNANYYRYNFRSNLDVNISKRLSVAFNIGGTVEQKSNPFDYNAGTEFTLLSTLPPNAFPIYNPNGTYSGSTLYGTSGVNSNPLANLLETGFYLSNSRTLQSALKFTEQLDMITPGLSISAAVSLNNYFLAGTRKFKTYNAYTLASSQSATPVAFGTGASTLGAAEDTRDQYRNYVVQGFLDYKQTFGKNDITAMGMIYTDNVTLQGNNTGPGTDPYIHNGGAARLTYRYNQKYIAEFSGGVTGSNDFPPGKRYGFFPAGSLGWVISGEDFLKQSKSINFLKLRGSYGLTGNDNIAGGRYQFFQSYTQTGTSGSYFFGTANTSVAGYAEGILANTNVTWEREKSGNLGLDATFFEHIDVSLDVYKRNRNNIAVSPAGTLPQFFGIISPLYNIGKSTNKGFEAAIQYSSNPAKAFQATLGTNVSYSVNKVVYNAEAVQLNAGAILTGYQIGQPLRYRAVGFWTQEEIDLKAANPTNQDIQLSLPAPVGVGIRPGDLKFKDIGGPSGKPDGVIDGNDQLQTFNTNVPKLTVGLHTGFKYKGFDLDAVVQGVNGVTTYLAGSYFTAFQNNGPASEIALGRWTPATAQTATYPRLSTVAASNSSNFRGSTFFERDGSFIKLRSAELGYTFPIVMTSKIKLKSARLFLTGTNLFSIDHIPYGDPESLGGYPVLRTFTLGAKIQL